MASMTGAGGGAWSRAWGRPQPVLRRAAVVAVAATLLVVAVLGGMVVGQEVTEPVDVMDLRPLFYGLLLGWVVGATLAAVVVVRAGLGALTAVGLLISGLVVGWTVLGSGGSTAVLVAVLAGAGLVALGHGFAGRSPAA